MRSIVGKGLVGFNFFMAGAYTTYGYAAHLAQESSWAVACVALHALLGFWILNSFRLKTWRDYDKEVSDERVQ